MSKQTEAIKLALEAMERYQVKRQDFDRFADEITALQKALANEALDKKAENARELGLDYEPAQQEPVDFALLLREAEEVVRERQAWMQFIDGEPLSNDLAFWMAVFAEDVARRTSPPAKRTWVGLTDEEIMQCLDQGYGINMRLDGFARIIEAKLKEKNVSTL